MKKVINQFKKEGKSIKNSNVRIRLSDVGSVVYIYNGKVYEELRVFETMLGHYFGEFLRTRKIGTRPVAKQKKNKK